MQQNEELKKIFSLQGKKSSSFVFGNKQYIFSSSPLKMLPSALKRFTQECQFGNSVL